MKLHLVGVLSSALLTSLPAFAQEDVLGAGDEPAPAQLLIDLKDDTGDDDERAIEALLGGLDIRLNSIYSSEERFFIADVDESLIADYVETLEGDDRVEHVEPNFIYEALGMPDDPMWDRQWGMRMIDTPEAWGHADGNGATVAVIDTGVAFENHASFRKVEDLGGTAFTKGYDFVSDDDHPNDDHGHGTHVAGTIAQTTNNKLGVAGVAPKAKIMPLKVLNRGGWGTVADISDAIRYAADEGAHVINMSLGGGARSKVMEEAVAYARKKGVVVVCAAGNSARNRVEYPAAYPGAFAVSAVGPDKKLSFYSSYGKELAVAAPGGDKNKGGEAGGILQNTITPSSVGKTDVYLAFQGTSMATPHVAGAAALLVSSGVTDPADVERILKETAEDQGDQERYGAGIINVGRAVKAGTQATGGLGHLLAGLGMLITFVFGLRRRLPGARLGLGAIIGAILSASGLFFLGSLAHVPVVGLFTQPMAAWDGEVFGASFRYTAVWASFIPLMGASVLLLSVRRLRGFLMGLSLGWAAHLLYTAFTMPSDVRFIPGIAGVLDASWLFVSAGVLILLAALIARVASKPRNS